MKFLEAVGNIFRIPDLRKRLLFVLALLAVYRLGGHIPIPGIDTNRFAEYIKQNQGSLFGFQRQDRISIAAGLRKNRDLSRKKFFAIAVPDWNIDQKENDEELAEEAKQMALAAAAAGIKPGAAHHK